jgi:hypothetical protein
MGKFRIDDWVLYCAFPESDYSMLSEERKSSVVLHVFEESNFYDYEIYIDGTGIIKKVREQNLFPVDKSNY